MTDASQPGSTLSSALIRVFSPNRVIKAPTASTTEGHHRAPMVALNFQSANYRDPLARCTPRAVSNREDDQGRLLDPRVGREPMTAIDPGPRCP